MMGKRNLIFYGDSNTYGYDPADLAENRYPDADRWTTIISTHLSATFRICPEGLNGRQLPDLKYDQGYLISLVKMAEENGIFCTMLGTNDLLLTLQPDADMAVKKMDEYLHFLKQYLKPEQIVVIAPPLIGSDIIRDPFYQRCFRESRKMNDGFRMLAEKACVIFADASLWEIDLSFDHVHFSKEGHQKFASKMMELIGSISNGS